MTSPEAPGTSASPLLSDLDLMGLHVEAEFTHDAAGRLVSTNEPAGAAAPRFFLGQTTAGGVIRRYRHDLPPTLREALEAASASDRLGDPTGGAPLDPLRFEHILCRDAPVRHTAAGMVFRFPPTLSAAPSGARLLGDTAQDAALLAPLLPAWVADLRCSRPLAALLLAGRAVAVCASVRITPRAHEAGVETAPAFRGRGHAAAVVAAWAAAVRGAGAEPLYSAGWQNTASRALAGRLGLVRSGRDLHLG